MKISRHNIIVGFVAGNAQKCGFKIKSLEGNHNNVTIYKPQLPEKLINHRPDVIGLNIDGAVCIGEAKTGADLKTRRSKTQLIDFVSIIRNRPDNLLIIGIPMGEKELLLKVLRDLRIIIDDQIRILEIPETFLHHD